MKLLSRLLLGLAALLAAVPASAQLAGGLSGSSGVRYMEAEETFSVIRNMGQCFAQRRNAYAASFLATTPGTPQEGVAVRALLGTSTSCTPRNSKLRLPRDIIRGAVAEAMYRRLHTVPPAAAEGAEAVGTPAATLVEFSRCVVRRIPHEVHSLITTTRLGSREEHEAVVRIAPQMQSCLPSAKSPEMVAPLVRLSLADALYDRARRLQPPRPGAR